MYKKVLLNWIAGALLVPIDVPLLLPENKASDTHITDIDVVDKKFNSDHTQRSLITGEADVLPIRQGHPTTVSS